MDRAIEEADFVNHLARTGDLYKIDSSDPTPGTPDFITALQIEWVTVAAGSRKHASHAAAIGGFMEAYYGSTASFPRPRSFGGFMDAWRSFAFTIAAPDASKDILGDDDLNSPYGKANLDFREYTGAGNVATINPPGPGATDLGAWASLAGADFLGSSTNVDQQLQQAFLAAFSAFSRYAPVPTGTLTTASLTNMWNDWLQRTTATVTGVPLPSGDLGRLQTYERIWIGYFGPLDTPEKQAAFNANVVAFANDQFAKEAYFLPTHFVERWVDTVKDAAARRGLLPFNSTIGGTNRANQALILNNVFDLLVEMIGVIQRVTSVLAQRLQFYADYQRALTKLMDQMPVFTSGGPSEALKSEGDGEEGTRADGNAANQAALETLRAHRDITGDETKQLQNTVNQLNDAASQQANIATAILQQLSGILTLIFR